MKTVAQRVLESSKLRANLEKMPAPTSVICDDCRRELKPGAMVIRYPDPATLTWRGTCSECSRLRERRKLKSHKCDISDVTLYGVCKKCGTVQPNSPLERFCESTQDLAPLDPEYRCYFAILQEDAHAEMYRRESKRIRNRQILADARSHKIPMSVGVALILEK